MATETLVCKYKKLSAKVTIDKKWKFWLTANCFSPDKTQNVWKSLGGRPHQTRDHIKFVNTVRWWNFHSWHFWPPSNYDHQADIHTSHCLDFASIRVKITISWVYVQGSLTSMVSTNYPGTCKNILLQVVSCKQYFYWCIVSQTRPVKFQCYDKLWHHNSRLFCCVSGVWKLKMMTVMSMLTFLPPHQFRFKFLEVYNHKTT